VAPSTESSSFIDRGDPGISALGAYDLVTGEVRPRS
jgi:hypothetical protein